MAIMLYDKEACFGLQELYNLEPTFPFYTYGGALLTLGKSQNNQNIFLGNLNICVILLDKNNG